MLCQQCRGSNAPGAKYCAVCGAPLPEELVIPNSYRDGYSSNASDYRRANNTPAPGADYRRYAPQNFRQYTPYPPQQPPQKSGRSAGAIVFYILSGLLALACLALPLLPHIRLYGMNGGRTYGALEYAIKLLDHNSLFYTNASGQLTGAVILIMFLVPMVFHLLWAIFSFVCIRSAGGVGLAGSILYTNVGLYWIAFLFDRAAIAGNWFVSGSGGTGDWLTVAPYLVVALGLTGIVFSSVQLAQRSRVR